jgi:parvulin-like peptidyl-prolyl isomerase
MRTFLTLCLLLANVMAATAFAGDRVVARVSNEAITHSALMTALEQNPDLTRPEAIDLLIERHLVLVWATGENISIGDVELEQVVASIRERNKLSADEFEKAIASTGETIESFRANLREQLTINKALGVALSAQTQISDDELQDLYLTTFPRKTVFEVNHILLAVEKEALAENDASVKRTAEQIFAEIAGGASFDTMASKYSKDVSSANKGGRLGTFKEGELLSELEKLATTLKPGEVGGPVRTSVGHHILQLVSRGLSDPPPFAEVKSALERNLIAKKEESARTLWLKDLKETIYFEIFPDDG